jgi:glycosyltransferase involved in cell wall biosynthesis
VENLVSLASVRSSALSIAIPKQLEAHFGGRSGDSRMWTSVTRELRRVGVTIRAVDPVNRRRFGRRVQVWLSSGHAGPLGVDEPVVIQLHEAPWDEDHEIHALDENFRRPMAEASHAAAAKAAAIITPSEFSRHQVIEAHGVDPDVVHAVPHGVDPATFHPGRASAGRQLVDRAGWTGPYVVGVMSVHPRKNVPVLRQAMQLLAERGHPHGLVLVLSPALDRADSAELDRQAAGPIPGLEGRLVIFRALSEQDLAGVIAAADALALPSRSEGFGFPALEAMACGTPAVVSDRGSLPEVIGTAGVLVTPDPDALADGLHSVITDGALATRLATIGLERSQAFTWEASATQWKKVLEEAARR